MSRTHPTAPARRTPRLALAVAFFAMLALFIPQAIPQARAADLPVTVTTTATTATITWTPPSQPTNWTVGRDGKDSSGYGAWSTTVPGNTRSWTFNDLVPGSTYNLYARSSVGNAAVRIVAGQTSTPTPTPTPTTPTAPGSKAQQLFGKPRSGLAWHSGVWTAAPFSTSAVDGFGSWRGRQVDFVTTYGYKDSPAKLMDDEWPITTFAGFGGRLNYGLPLAFGTGERTKDVASGSLDHVYRDVARDLVKHRRGDSLIRLGWEYNLSDWTWGTTASTVESYKAAYRRVVGVMRAEAPGLKFEFGINCGSGLSGNGDRLAALNVGYPGDAYVDLVGCDTYDWWTTTAADFGKVLRAPYGPGIADVADFARARGKGLSFGEWGLAASREGNNWTGRGDDPAYIEKMFAFFKANADILVMESYFDEPDGYIANSLYRNGQNPNAGARYRALWSKG